MKNFWYIQYDKIPVKILPSIKGCGFTIPAWEGWNDGIMDVTLFLTKKLAMSALKFLRDSKTKEEQKKFKLVRFINGRGIVYNA